MATLYIGTQKIEAPDGKRLVNAIEDGGIDILHRCGGYAKCTTCRVTFSQGEPTRMTQAEKERLQADEGLYGKVRLSCQVLCEGEMHFSIAMTLSGSGLDSAGKRPEDHLTPEPVWDVKD